MNQLQPQGPIVIDSGKEFMQITRTTVPLTTLTYLSPIVLVQARVNIWVMDVSQRPLWESFLLSVIKLSELVTHSMNFKVLVQSKSFHIKGGRASSSRSPSV